MSLLTNFSIITASYRQLDWLKLCVRSVSDQVLCKSELISVTHIIQDNSSPNIEQFSAELLSVPRSSKVEVHVEPDSGMYDAINKGLRRAEGDIIAYINSDEQYLPGALSKVAAFFRRNPSVEVLFGDAILTHANGAPLSYRQAILPTRSHITYCHLNTLTCATFFRRSLLEKGHYFDPRFKISGDAAWVLSCLDSRCNMAVLNEPLSTFSFTGNNLSEVSKASNTSESLTNKTERAPVRRMKASFYSLKHRASKLLSGAYHRRNISYSIYTQESLEHRKDFQAMKIKTSWPRVKDTIFP